MIGDRSPAGPRVTDFDLRRGFLDGYFSFLDGLEELRVGFLDGRRALDGLHRDMRFFSKLRP